MQLYGDFEEVKEFDSSYASVRFQIVFRVFGMHCVSQDLKQPGYRLISPVKTEG